MALYQPENMLTPSSISIESCSICFDLRGTVFSLRFQEIHQVSDCMRCVVKVETLIFVLLALYRKVT